VRRLAKRLAAGLERKLSGLLIRSLATVERGSPPLRRLGTAYGGWHFLPVASLRGATIVSCGVGEDISFDVEIAASEQARVILVDPTPRASEHLAMVLRRLGRTPSEDPAPGGCQPPGSYDLSAITDGQLVPVAKALWNRPGQLRFYAPQDPSHVSFSLINWQNGYETAGEAITVEAITFPALLEQLDGIQPALVKLDIEGAEHEVLSDMLNHAILPPQLLVEFDELNAGKLRGALRFRRTHRQLLASGYRLVVREGPNFSYAQKTLLRYAGTR
jgi:FkbM family methyltransferase